MSVTRTISDELAKRIEDTLKFQQKFSVLLKDKPYTLQKCSLHGLILAKEIIAKARDEVNDQCQVDLANQLKKAQAEIQKLQQNSAILGNVFSTKLEEQEEEKEED